MGVKVSLVVPAFNEEERIPRTINEITNFFKDQSYSWELIVVDDGSRDETDKLAQEVAARSSDRITVLRNKVNKGKGYSVKRGILAARGERVIFTDADLSTPVEEINNCLRWLGEADVVVGSRALVDSKIILHQPRHREMMGRLFNKAVQAMAVRGIKDTQCGFKGFSKKAAWEVFSRQSLCGFGFDVEVLYIARRLGFRIVEIPITWKNSASSRVNPLQDGFGMLGDLARVRINHIKGFYSFSKLYDDDR